MFFIFAAVCPIAIILAVSENILSGWRHQLMAEVVTRLISHHPGCEIGVDIIQPGSKRVRIDP